MRINLIQWIDRSGSTHRVRMDRDLSRPERKLLDILWQQTTINLRLLEAGYLTPALSQGRPNMLRMMLRVLLPGVAADEITAFDSTEGHDLLVQWWAVTDATRLSA